MIFQFAEYCLHSGSIEEKLRVTREAGELRAAGKLLISADSEPLAIDRTQFPDTPQLVHPRDLPRRGLSTMNGRIALLHSLAHIEFYAIHLAWDILYRFREMPEGFYTDWLQVATEEALHFRLLRTRLQSLGADYGLLAAHRGLWDVAVDTADDLLARLALVPRTLEARGLDVTPGMIEKLLRVGDTESAEILKKILQDEIGHVKIGSHWFGVVCSERGVEKDDAYFGLLNRFLKGRIRGPINYELRLEAGFSETELARLRELE